MRPDVLVSPEPRRASLLGVAAGCAAGFSTGWNISNIGAVAPSLAREYGISVAAIGLFTGGFYLAHSTLQLPAGKASDRFGPRIVSLVGLALVVLFNALAMVVLDPAAAVGARIVVGVGTALGFVGALEYVRAVGGSVAVGLFGGVGVGAGAVALAVVPQVEPAAGWRAPFLTASLVGLLGLVFLGAAPDARRHPTERERTPTVGIVSLLAGRRLRQIGIVYAGSLGLSIVVGNWIVTLLVREGGVSHAAAGPIASLSLFAGILTRPLGGWALRWGTRGIRIAVGVSIAGGIVGTLALTAARPLPLTIAGSLLVGLSSGFPFAPALAAAARARPDAPGAAVGFVNMCGGLTILLGVPLLGLTFSLPGGGRTGFVAVALLWSACVLAVPGAFAEEAKPRRREPL